MSAWNIQVSEVSGVLAAVGEHIGDEEGTSGLTGDMRLLGLHLEQAAASSDSDPIGIALGAFAEHCFGTLQGMAELSASAVNGAGSATLYYVEGDTDMAAEAQDNAGAVEDPPQATGGGTVFHY
ncbi:DUF6507 family protein [Nocardiopsis alborubida]|uniref:Uncharacterized protein n=1 Tax=Nocardiopsis alborubida TaxID=146802 RepID=A0A7X6MHB2_9ACTN|nr:DUF6507 family protein [Nocardiopsis alborubida]NKY99688.1 hypothetical protein [Nocardiopsis alborubida]